MSLFLSLSANALLNESLKTPDKPQEHFHACITTASSSWYRIVGVVNKTKFPPLMQVRDRLCGLVVRVLGHRSGGPDSIPGTTRKKK
jgi:hypothetical protein